MGSLALRSTTGTQRGADRGDDLPPRVTQTNEVRKPVPENRRRIQPSPRSSDAITASASSTAVVVITLR
jgi:hypothetical protein